MAIVVIVRNKLSLVPVLDWVLPVEMPLASSGDQVEWITDGTRESDGAMRDRSRDSQFADEISLLLVPFAEHPRGWIAGRAAGKITQTSALVKEFPGEDSRGVLVSVDDGLDVTFWIGGEIGGCI